MRRRWAALPAGVLVVAAAAVALVATGGEAPRADRTTALPAGGGAAGLAISPVRTVVPAGKSKATLAYTLGNNGSSRRTYTIGSVELGPAGRPLPNSSRSAAGWVRPRATTVVVPPHGSRVARVAVRVPQDRGASERRIGVTFTDTTPRSGTVGMRAQVFTSVYVEGAGPKVHRTRLSDLRLPFLARGDMTASATLHNGGTTTVVPGSDRDAVVGTMSHGPAFVLGGPVVPANTKTRVSGAVRDLPMVCWCQVRVSAGDGRGGTTSVQGHVLVLPWPQLLVVLGLALLLGLVVALRRRRAGRTATPQVPSRAAARPRPNRAPAFTAEAPATRAARGVTPGPASSSATRRATTKASTTKATKATAATITATKVQATKVQATKATGCDEPRQAGRHQGTRVDEPRREGAHDHGHDDQGRHQATREEERHPGRHRDHRDDVRPGSQDQDGRPEGGRRRSVHHDPLAGADLVAAGRNDQRVPS